MILVEITVREGAQWYFAGIPVKIKSASGSVVYLDGPLDDPRLMGFQDVVGILAHRPGGEFWQATLFPGTPDELRLDMFAEAWCDLDERARAFWEALCDTIATEKEEGEWKSSR